MKTRICRLHGQNDLRIETVELDEPGPNEVLVAVAAGGICGSDMHYLSDGGIGTIRVREPIILGHEASGRVLAVGVAVTSPRPGDPVAINPSSPCGECTYCAEGLPMHCLNMRFRGSAIRLPHEQGLFRDRVPVDAGQCIVVPDGSDLSHVACAEPLAVCLHAARIAGSVAGKRVLVTGAGPIGCLTTAVAIRGGAVEVVVTDIEDHALGIAREMGATSTINVSETPDDMARFAAEKGHFDVAFECSAAPPAIASAIACLRPRGTLVQVGVAGDTPLPINALVAKEIVMKGTHRFHDEFAEAVDAITSGRLNLGPIITSRYPLDAAASAFEAAADRSRSCKVHLTFDGVA